MRAGGYGLIALGVIIAILGAVNHFILQMNPVPHTTTILVAVGVVLALVGLILSFMGGQSAAN